MKSAIVAPFFLLALNSAAADLREPTDIELRASYCIGVLQENLRAMETATGDVRAAVGDEKMKEWQAQSVNTLKRLQAYAVPRMSYVDGFGMNAAREQGIRDVQENSRIARLNSEKTDACMKSRCDGLSSTCIKDCQADPFLRCFLSLEGPAEEARAKCADKEDPFYLKVRACHKLDWLPF